MHPGQLDEDSTDFDLFIMVVIALNTVTMSMQYYNQPPAYTHTLNTINTVFVGIFTAEACTKLLALGRKAYFREGWNRYSISGI